MPLCKAMRREMPEIEIISGGGVRTFDDLLLMQQSGCDAALVAMAFSKNNERLVAGAMDGTLVFGIPGDAVTAIVLGALMMVLGIQMISLGLIGELIIFVNAGGVTDYQIERVYETNADSCHDQL